MNSYVPAYLIGQKRIPGQLPAYISWGDDSEAVAYAASYLSLWRRTVGAIDWLKEGFNLSRAADSTPKRATKKRGRHH